MFIAGDRVVCIRENEKHKPGDLFILKQDTIDYFNHSSNKPCYRRYPYIHPSHDIEEEMCTLCGLYIGQPPIALECSNTSEDEEKLALALLKYRTERVDYLIKKRGGIK